MRCSWTPNISAARCISTAMFFSVVPKSKVKIVAKMLKAIHVQESKKASREKAKVVVSELRAMKLKEAAKKVEGGKLNPQNNATRAQVAAILMRFCEMSK